MLYLLMGLGAASLYGVATFALHGYGGLTDSVWLDYVFWWLIGTGGLLSGLEVRFGLRCPICRLRPKTPVCGQVMDRPKLSPAVGSRP